MNTQTERTSHRPGGHISPVAPLDRHPTLTAPLNALALIGRAGLRASAPIDPAIRAKVDTQVKKLRLWAANAGLVQPVQAHNANLPADKAAMTREKCEELSIINPFVRSMGRNPVAVALNQKKPNVVSEASGSGADDLKVAHLAKPGTWSHKWKDKHDVPMTGKVWPGRLEMDISNGLQQIRITLPVLDGGRSTGSLVAGLGMTTPGKETQ